MLPQTKEVPPSIIQNYIRLQHLINTTSSGVIRDQFRDKWKTQFNSDWENLPKDGRKFIQTFGQSLPQRIGRSQRKLLKLGDIQEWDIPLLIDALKCLGLDEDSSSKLEQIKDIQIKCLHQGFIKFYNRQFEDFWNKISNILTSFGVDQDELLRIKEIDPLDYEQQQPNIKDELNEANLVLAKELKQKGMEILRGKKYRDAIYMLTEALELPRIRSKDRAVLYSIRSMAHLKLADPAGAKRDAESAILFHPFWWKPYHRLASSYKAQKRYERSIQYLSIARGLEPRNPYLVNDWYHCRHLQEELRLSRLKETITMGLTYRLKETIIKGRTYRHSRWGVKQDDKKAYEYFSKAAAHGYAEGLHYIGQMTQIGLGTDRPYRNVPESIRLLKLAAKQEPITIIQGSLVRNPGVKEANYSLGLFYGRGDEEFPQDGQKAEYWYSRAIQSRCGLSAHNLGTMYYSGRGFVKDPDKAINYWKIGCWLKDIHSIDSLAIAYWKKKDRKNTHKFYAYGISQESPKMKDNMDSFKKLLKKDLNKPLNIQEFEQELLNEIKSGPFKNLVPVAFDHNHNQFKKMQMLRGGPRLKKNLTDLADPYRVQLIKNYRRDMKKERTDVYYANYPGPQPKPVVNLPFAKPIYFRNMTPKTNRVYTGFLIVLTLIEDAIVRPDVICLIAEDKYRDVRMIYVKKFNLDNKKIQDTFGFGCNITIINPEYRDKIGEKPGLWVEHPSTLFHSPDLSNKKRCRYCGDQRHDTACRRCNLAFYCSDLCKKQDKLLMHSVICKKGPPRLLLKFVENPGYGLNPRIQPVPLELILRR